MKSQNASVLPLLDGQRETDNQNEQFSNPTYLDVIVVSVYNPSLIIPNRIVDSAIR